MENDAFVREILKLISGKKPTILEEMVAHSSIPSEVPDEDFSKKLNDVVGMRNYIANIVWVKYFEKHSRDMFSSHERYLRHFMYLCLIQHHCNQNIFDTFISLCALVMNASNGAFVNAGINFSDLNPDIFMVFYRNVLKSSFLQCRGFYGFAEYIRRHKYLEWNRDENDLNLSFCDPASVNFKPDLQENIKKELISLYFKGISEDTLKGICVTARRMAREVLSTTSSKLPVLPSENDLIKKLVASRKQILAKKADIKRRDERTSKFVTSHGDSSSNSVSKTNYVKQQQENISRHENIIEAVIRHNHSNMSRHEKVNDQNQVEADRTLEHLENSIKSLIEVLDECNKE